MQNPNQNHLILEMDEQDKIKLGKRRPGVHQQDRLNRQHEDAMAGQEIQTKTYGNGINVESHHKESADPFPHQCRYYRGCQQSVLENRVDNKVHFDNAHPLTLDEEHFYLTIYRQSQGGKTVHELSILFGRSEDTIKQVLSKNGILSTPKWTKRGQEIEALHQKIKVNRAAIVHDYTQLVEQHTFLDVGNNFPIPTDVESIQKQNYLTGEHDNAHTAVQQLLEQYGYLKDWKVEAEEREQEYKDRIESLQNYAVKLDKLLLQFTTDYNALIHGEEMTSQEIDEENPPALTL